MAQQDNVIQFLMGTIKIFQACITLFRILCIFATNKKNCYELQT